MLSRHVLLAGLVSAAILAPAVRADAAMRHPDQTAPLMRSLDRDRDGTADWAEVRRAASAYFARLDTDHDGTLSLREFEAPLRAAHPGRASSGLRARRNAFRAMDRDHDGTVSRAEYLAVVRTRFRRADPDRDGTLSARELRRPAGRALAALLGP